MVDSVSVELEDSDDDVSQAQLRRSKNSNELKMVCVCESITRGGQDQHVQTTLRNFFPPSVLPSSFTTHPAAAAAPPPAIATCPVTLPFHIITSPNNFKQTEMYAWNILSALSLLVSLTAPTAAQIVYDSIHNKTSLVGTWSSGSKNVVTGLVRKHACFLQLGDLLN